MPCTQDDFLAIARENSQPEASEIALRSAISRAYYAAFHAAKFFHDKLPAPGEPAPSGMGVHSALCYKLGRPRSSIIGQEKATLSRSIKYMCEGLKPMRVKADYELTETIVYGDAENAIAIASKIVNKTKLG